MYRTAEEGLQRWFQQSSRKPLILRGARQVGKSTLVRQFCASQDLNLVEINLEKHSQLERIFQTLNIEKISLELEALSGKSLSQEKSLLFLDEIQATPHALMALRYFYEERPRLPVIAAGSLLEFVLEDHDFSMPVGRIQYFYLGPMTFSEFIKAQGKENLFKYFSLKEIPQVVHEELTQQVRNFLYVGGMPEAVKIFAEKKDIHEVRESHRSIIDTYCSDFDKYSKKHEKLRMEKVWRWVPRGLGEKLKFVNISREDQARDIAHALQLLIKARVLLPIYHSRCNGTPLASGMDESTFKLFFLDVGLISTMQDLSFSSLNHFDENHLINKGKLVEQFVAQHLFYRYATSPSQSPELFYWLRDKKGSSAELDFVISLEDKIMPVEVKAGKIGRMKSLEIFLEEKKLSDAIRFDFSPKQILSKVQGKKKVYSFPIYMIDHFASDITLS